METSGIVLLVLGLALYFIPTIVGWKTKYSSGILLLNLFLGWTVLGWLGALIWAISSPKESSSWIYTCSKCGYKRTLNQKITLFVCPQCKNETSYKTI
jgi:hypothetical protein